MTKRNNILSSLAAGTCDSIELWPHNKIHAGLQATSIPYSHLYLFQNLHTRILALLTSSPTPNSPAHGSPCPKLLYSSFSSFNPYNSFSLYPCYFQSLSLSSLMTRSSILWGSHVISLLRKQTSKPIKAGVYRCTSVYLNLTFRVCNWKWSQKARLGLVSWES